MLRYSPNFDALPIGLAHLDADLTIRGWNATLAGWAAIPAEHADGKQLSELFPEFNAAKYERRLKSVFEQGQTVVFAAKMQERFLPLVLPGGRPLLHKVRISRLPENPEIALVVIEDVTHSVEQLHELRNERRRLRATEASLREQQVALEAINDTLTEARRKAEYANEAKSAFLANMSHEIRTPLTAINGFAQIVCEYSNDPFVLDAGERVLRNGEHLLSVVNDILDLSKIEAGKIELEAEQCDTREIILGVIETFEDQANKRGLDLSASIDPDAPTHIVADPLRLRQILINLVSNAIKFTAEGSVTIRAARVDNLLELSVTDTGIGISDRKQAAIFEPFSQVDGTMRREYGGTGLGLSICKNLVEQMEGLIAVESVPKRGSTFTVCLPAPDVLTESVDQKSREGTPWEPESQEQKSLSNKQLAGATVVVAEDGVDNQKLIEFLLTRAGAEVEVYENGKFALDAVLKSGRTSEVDLIILDMQMPVMDGYSAAAALRHVGHEGPIMALTAHAMDGDRKKALDAGCDAYAAKPINTKELIDMCRGLIQSEAKEAV